MTEIDIKLSADSDCNEQRAAAVEQIIVWTLACFLSVCLKILKKNETYLFSESFTISSVTHANSQQSYLHEELSCCRSSLWVLINDVQHSDDSFNSLQFPQSTSKPSRSPPLSHARVPQFPQSVFSLKFRNIFCRGLLVMDVHYR